MPRRPKSESQTATSNINLETIASALGVAVSTVSRALNNHPGIHPTTRLRIQTEAARLGYAVKRRGEENAAANPSRKIRHLLTLAQTINHASQQGYLTGISRAAQANDVGVFSHHCTAENAALILEPARQPAALKIPDLTGVIFIHRWPEAVVARIAETRPCVSLIHRYPGLPVDMVGIDDESNIAMLVAHLRARGHKRIGFFGYEKSYSWACSRFAAYVGALAAAGLDYNPADVLPVSIEEASAHQPPDLRGSLPAIRARLKAGVSAWISSSFVLAQGLCLTLRAAGLAVPGDVSVTGCHGAARTMQPGVPHPTSVETNDEEIGAASVYLLTQRALRAVPAPTVLLLPGYIVQGDSTSALPT